MCLKSKCSVLLLALFGQLAMAQWEVLIDVSISQEDHYLSGFLEIPKDDVAIIGTGSKYFNLDDGKLILSQIEGQQGFLLSSDFTDEKVGFLGGGCYFPTPNCSANSLYKTIDGGKTWQRVESDITFENANFGNVISIEVLNKNEVLILLEYQGLYRINLSDNSISYINIKEDITQNNFEHFTIFDEEHWMIRIREYVMGNALRRTFISKDAGSSWEEIVLDETAENHLLQVQYITKDSWIASSISGRIYLISDQQRQEVFNPGDSNFDRGMSLVVYNEKNIYLSTYHNEDKSSAVYKSKDGGYTWELEFETEGQISQLHFNSPGHGYALLDSKVLLERTPEIETILPNEELTAFPNPALDILCIPALEDLSNLRIDLYDAAGKLVALPTIKDGVMAVGDLAAGVYMARIFDHQNLAKGIVKFVKAN